MDIQQRVIDEQAGQVSEWENKEVTVWECHPWNNAEAEAVSGKTEESQLSETTMLLQWVMQICMENYLNCLTSLFEGVSDETYLHKHKKHNSYFMQLIKLCFGSYQTRSRRIDELYWILIVLENALYKQQRRYEFATQSKILLRVHWFQFDFN